MEGVFEALAAGLRGRGHTVVQGYSEPAFEREPGGERWGLPLRTIQTRRKVPTPASVAAWAADTVRLARLLRRLRPDVVNVHYVTDRALPFLVLRRAFGYRLVLTSHGSDLLRRPNPVSRLVVPHLLSQADAVVAVSEAVAERARELAPAARVELIENGVDLAFWSRGEAAAPPPGAGRIVQVGRLHEVKGQDVLLRALARLRDRVPEATVELVGEGESQDRLETLAAELGVAHAVTFAGPLGREGVRGRLRAADVFALPSRSEAFGLALLEAMAAGVPAVATAVGGVPRMVGDPPAALLVPPEDPGPLADALYRAVTDVGLARALRERGTERASNFSWDRALSAYEAVLAPSSGER